MLQRAGSNHALTRQLIVDPAQIARFSTGPSDVYDVPLSPRVADCLYDYVNTYRYVLSRIFS